ncbi:MAG TPA: SHOCT domain-containing protein [Gemmataceae bacterium]|nr:SHOCT domain-containing protein [Gemmataceae bacterium]
MDAAWQAIAKADPVRPPLWDARLLWLTLALVAVILIGALVLVWIDRWRKRAGSERMSANDQLASFRELYEKGQLSQEEFDRIRALLSTQLRRELDLPTTPPSTAAEQNPASGEPTEPGSPPV